MVLSGDTLAYEDRPTPLIRHGSYLLSLFVDFLISLLSALIVLGQFIRAPDASAWNFVLTYRQAAAVFLILAVVGFGTSRVMLVRIKRRIANEGFALISVGRMILSFSFPFVIIIGVLSFSLAMLEVGLPFFWAFPVFYGFVFGYVVSRMLFIATDSKRWILTRIINNQSGKRRRVRQYRITHK